MMPVAVSEYVVVAFGVTVIEVAVAPVDHRTLEKVPVAESVTGEPGWQLDAGPLIATVGAGETETETGADVVWHPAPSVTVTKKLPEDVTVIDCVCAPFDQR